MKTATLDVAEETAATQAKGRQAKPPGIHNLPALAPSGRAKPAGKPAVEVGKPERPIGPAQVEADKAVKAAAAATKAAKAAKVAAAKANQVGQVAETPAESIAIARHYKPEFTAETKAWLILGKSGQMRVADVPVIAAHLANKKTQYVFNEALPSLGTLLHAETDAEKASRKQAGETLKAIRKSYRTMTPEKKTEWLNKAKPIFNRTLREFLKKVKPLKKAFDDARFQVSRATVHLTKKGIVHVAKQATHRPEVA